MSSRIKKKKEGTSTLTPTEVILESISDGVFTVDTQWLVTSFNRAAEEITGVKRSDAIGRRCSEVFRSSLCGADCALAQTFATRKPIIGISAYIVDSEGNRIPISISTALLHDAEGRVTGGAETFRDLSEVETLRQELTGKFRVGDLISHSPLMQRVFEALPAIAASPSTVLLLGETGTGKELVARTIHHLSPRRDGPFVAVNCGALPDTLLESELFGYKAGAFTGAKKDKPGRFTLAGGGTIFLDEIGEVSPALQVKLLRVLQERTYEPLGSTRSEQADVRVVTATNRDLAERMQEGAFREDLYYRLNVVRIELPPLRRRKEDIPLLVDQFVTRFNRLRKTDVKGITAEALSLLMAHDWPGNIREVENAIEHAFILCHEGYIDIRHLPEELRARGSGAGFVSDIRSAHEILEGQAIQTALERTAFNRVAAARMLGIHKTTLYRQMKKLGIAPPKRDSRKRREK
ncbi:MAG: sigma 54-interacting transcriptional regulator [Syntrophales bacterium]|jgi:PAS domain S-box-containing protein|nr:sigma 54-interacting transcriptional regulator [Syntrophales bacterium]MDD4340158.1 sigma 54-interacting transcriptional regulator [Syntrophales bacterium]HOG07383.1 sigma 54-interacting transcriptional regulator [Syntrophales bacterium]